MVVEIKRVVKYPPEIFIEALPFNLLAGDNKVALYAGFSPYILGFQGFSFSQIDGLKFYANVDGISEVVRMDNLVASKGLDYEEDMKFASYMNAELRIYAPTAIPNYAWRYKVAVFKPTTVLKLKLDIPLSSEDKRLEEKYNLKKQLKLKTPQQFDPYFGIEEWRTQSIRMTGSGTVLRKTVPTGMKYIITNISATRPISPGSAYIRVERDNIENVLVLDLYCLQSLSYNYPIRIVALEDLEVTLEVVSPGTYDVRVVYGIGKITLKEKVMWGIDLDESERKLAEEEDLFDKVAAGVA